MEADRTELHDLASTHPEKLNELKSLYEAWAKRCAGRSWARTGDEIPLALLHMAAARADKSDLMPAPIRDSRFFHCEFHGKLEEHQQKRADKRTYDDLVFYGGS